MKKIYIKTCLPGRNIKIYINNIIRLSIQIVGLDVGLYLRLPLVADAEQLLLVVEEFFVGVRGVLEVRALHNSIHRAGLLTEPTEDALCHVNVVAGGAPGTVLPLLRLYGDGLGRADGLTQLAGDAALLPCRVAAQRVLSSEPGAEGSLLKGVLDGDRIPEHVAKNNRVGSEEFPEDQFVDAVRFDFLP